MKYKYDMYEEDRINREMCGPGYVWNETLGKCLGAGGGERAEAKERAQNAAPKAEIVE